MQTQTLLIPWTPSPLHPSTPPQPRLLLCTTIALFFLLLVPGFSTASYLKVHIKTHHGSPLPPSATMHTFPEVRGGLQMHNGTAYHMGRQSSVEGKQSPPPSQSSVSLASLCFAALLGIVFLHRCPCCRHQANIHLTPPHPPPSTPAHEPLRIEQFHSLPVFAEDNVSVLSLLTKCRSRSFKPGLHNSVPNIWWKL